MYNSAFIRKVLLIAVLVVGVIILPAQVNQKENTQQLDNGNAAYHEEPDTIPPPDNTEGLAELDKIIQRYEGGSLYLSGEILFYENADSASIPQERNSFIAINTALASSYEIDSIQTIMNETMTLLVDKKEKSMAIVERDMETNPATSKQDIATELKQFREYIHSIVVNNNNGTERKLTIQFKEDAPANTSSYEIVYEPSTHRVRSVRMEMTDGTITDGNEEGQSEEDELVFVDANHKEISTGYYAKVKTSVYQVIYKIERKADPVLLDINRFVTKTAEGYAPAVFFKNYEILN
jgi:hypothetical protein